ncbi:ISKra4 family transposase [Skermanella aerolata]|uniref:ISKra4 family transposase n=1 Tax=Skermanella aerolata TaxID=393310 RepID=UPI003D1EA85D
MHVHLQLRIVGDDGTVFTDCEILRLVKSHHQLEAVGLSIGESKSLQECLQQHIVTAQAAAFVDRHRCCPACGRHLCRKGKYPFVFRTAFGNVALSSPRFYRCGCQPDGSRTFSPLTELFTEHTAPELLYLETRWASLISFGMTAALLRDVLPVADTTNPETVRQHLYRVADRHDADLRTRQPDLMDDGAAAGQTSLIPLEAVIVGIDGGYLRNWHDKRKKFEVIVGKSMAEDRDDRYFGLVRSQDAAPKRRFCEVLRRQGLPADQPVTVLTDGGDSVRALVGDLPAGSEHVLDWFHVAMRLTGLAHYTRGLAHYNPLEATALQDRLERIKWRLWHGDASEALNRARALAEDVTVLVSGYPGLTRLVKATAGLTTYIENNSAAITDYAERWDHGEIISTAVAESTVDLVVSRRLAKKQQMQWSTKGAHQLLQTRTRTLDGTLYDLFTSWYPAMPANDVQPAPFAAAA